MRSIRPLFAALTIFALFATSAFAMGARLVGRDVKWREPGILLARDTTFMTSEVDTTRTEWISTADWDWEAMFFSDLAANQGGAVVTFWSQNLTNNGVTDTLYYLVERGVRRRGDDAISADSVIAQFQGTSAAALGNVALSNGASPNSNVWTGTLISDQDQVTQNGINIYGAEFIRLRVHGDQDGTTPKISQLRCRITYLKRP